MTETVSVDARSRYSASASVLPCNRDVTATRSNRAVTAVAAAPIVGVHVAVPLHAPLQPAKKEPVAAVAVNVACDPKRNVALHRLPHAMPCGSLVTVPAPVPVFVTLTGKLSRSNTAVTCIAAASVTVQPPLPEHDPVHATNFEPVAGCGVSDTVVPQSNVFVHVDPQSIPEGVLTTEPVPVPVVETVTS